MKLWVIVSFLCLFFLSSYGQDSTSDSLEMLTVKTHLHTNIAKIDSVEALFIYATDSLKQEYQEALMTIDSSMRRLQLTLTIIDSLQRSLTNSLSASRVKSMQMELKSKIDSLTLIHEYSSKVSRVLDSVRAFEEKTFAEFNTKIQSLKEKTLGRLNDMKLSPQLSEKISEASSRINDYQLRNWDISTPDVKGIKGLEIDVLKNLDLHSEYGLNLDKLKDLGNIGVLSDVSKLARSAGEQMKALQDVSKGKLSGIDAIGNLAESRVAELSGLGEIKDRTEALNEFKGLTEKIKDPDTLKEYAIEQVTEIAVDHFSGKEEQLNEAMQTLARYKSKYPNLNSISEATRRPTNEMKGKPFIERVVPGIALQIRKKDDDFMVDFNPYVGYRFTARVSAGLGWNQRLAYNFARERFNSLAQVFGPRLFGEFKLRRGFLPRAEIEIMNTTIPPLARNHSFDPVAREWVWGAFAGIRKEYKLTNNVNGTASVMVRLYNPDHKSPYTDVVNARIGFEFPMKKRLTKSDP